VLITFHHKSLACYEMLHRAFVLNRMFGLDSTGSGYGPAAGSCRGGNERSGSIRTREFVDQLSDYQVIKKDSASLS
jgi:hypothetical protein